MNKGPLVTLVVAIIAIGMVLAAFTRNASPYVTVREARLTGGDHLHIFGTPDKSTIHQDILHRTLTFTMKDLEGTPIQVVYTGDMPGNLEEATQVVAQGALHGNEFRSDKLLLKCPSKYDSASKKRLATR